MIVENILTAVVELATVKTLLLMSVGAMAGLLAGSIPGFTIAMAIVLTLPFTFGMEAAQGIAVMIGVYVGGLSGGLMSGILIGIPGTPSSVATTFDGSTDTDTATGTGTYAHPTLTLRTDTETVASPPSSVADADAGTCMRRSSSTMRSAVSDTPTAPLMYATDASTVGRDKSGVTSVCGWPTRVDAPSTSSATTVGGRKASYSTRTGSTVKGLAAQRA